MNSPLPKNSDPRPRPAGFTLIELLIVIAIIGVMAGILFPVVTNMRLRADTTSSVNSMRQLGTALAVVASDSNNTLPIGYGPDTVIVNPAPPSPSNFQKRLSVSPSQFGNTIPPATWVPLFRNKSATSREKYSPSIYPYVGATPYGVNAVLDNDVKNGAQLYGDKVSGTWSPTRIPRPAGTVILADTWINPAYAAAGQEGGSADGAFDYKKAQKTAGAISYRHSGGQAALMFADWHIQLVTQAEVTANAGAWFDPAKQQ